jgi:hypothetical protein
MQHQHTPEFIKSVTVEPGKLKTIYLGLFEDAMPEPEVTVSFHPYTPDGVAHKLARIKRDDMYELVCHLQSYSDTPVKVTVEAS